MTDEKIFDSEKLTDDELDEVAGGTLDELKEDRSRLIELGYYEIIGNQRFSTGINNALAKFGKENGMKMTMKYHKHEANQYFINGEEVTRDELWIKILRTLKQKK